MVIRGLDKFTGLTATDEDDVSEAPERKRLFFAGGRSHLEADTLFVTTKSNGENAKATLREIGGEWWVLAGSKNVCLACPVATDPRTVYNNTDPTIPSWKILNAFHEYVTGVVRDELDALEELGRVLHDNHYVVLFEFNNATHEHLFPIEADFLDGFAIRGVGSAAIDPVTTFALFDKYQFPAVKVEKRAVAELDDIVAEVRADTTTEGVVVYFMLDGEVIGLLKVKSDFYTLARATREQFKRLGNSVFRALKALQPRAPSGAVREAVTISRATLTDVENRIRRRMARMDQIPSYETDHEAWAARAVAFCHYWLDNVYNKAPLTIEARKAAIEASRAKFGTLYAKFYAQYVPGAEVEAGVAGASGGGL
ncbi:uncharacterized protein AMSG_08445 [Thecamonas trahens ATCC 50062]|uniref:T4 RNA ligase 1-like N-terminal domain-containing protein n=1 Tax=Thecamonas trahens ATCC 50062 TaxID=461836 RepID=A0A0L0DMH7_THETB|nr:hypothetical protein AMSG_08445 [Thecamonas trahens ATCC 50062]KNC52583.1 hypothetical protein AMSG_08445 [Thecamonas trahens ATCC 50062]|eukprot:XP_013755143.1 hypothetical protein AMSG_08445 [Thecamonas trahens ATCC 50062]